MLKNFKTYHHAVNFYHHCKKIKLQKHLKDQLLRAASSIALNLAEGSGKCTSKDKKKFYYIAFGSLRECQAILQLADTNYKSLSDLLDITAAHLYKLIKHYE